MEDHRAASEYYAILIGINAYPDRPLKGCVRDVQDIKDYLQGALNSVQIQTLTATKSTDSESCLPMEDPMHWPTRDNVISAFEKVTLMSKPGNFVYIHYSGHGTRIEPSAEFSDTCTGDLALVLLLNEGEDERKRWLLGSRLALALKAMVDKGLVVTLVLDCCFSATVYRYDDPTIRSISCNMNINSKRLLFAENSLADGTISPVNRDASMRPNWLINPDGYAILVACGPHEFAKEPSQDGQSRGNLSYFLLKVLKEYGGLGKRHKDIYQHLCARFRESWPQQNPILYGNIHQSFFGHMDSGIDATSVAIVRRKAGLQLQAGQAHGVCDGDRFALHPLGSVGRDSKSWTDSVIAKVVLVRALTSDLELLEATPVLVQTGWIARPLTRCFLEKFSIRLASGLPRRDQLLAALKERSLDVHNDISEHQFHVVLNTNGEYEILDERDEKIVNLPSMPQAQTEVYDICEIIEHLARYMMARRLVNDIPTDSFLESFSAEIISYSKEVWKPGCTLEVKEGEEARFTLQVENRGKGNLYLYIYDIGPCWQVQNIYHGSHAAIPPRLSSEGFTGVFSRNLKTVVPPEIRKEAHGHCEDIIKVFLTSQPTSFDLLELPKLGKSINSGKTNKSDREESSSEDWAALSFTIRTFYFL